MKYLCNYSFYNDIDEGDITWQERAEPVGFLATPEMAKAKVLDEIEDYLTDGRYIAGVGSTANLHWVDGEFSTEFGHIIHYKLYHGDYQVGQLTCRKLLEF